MLVDEFVVAVVVFPDHLELTRAGVPPLNVTYAEVGLEESEFVRVGEPICTCCYQGPLAALAVVGSPFGCGSGPARPVKAEGRPRRGLTGRCPGCRDDGSELGWAGLVVALPRLAKGHGLTLKVESQG